MASIRTARTIRAVAAAAALPLAVTLFSGVATADNGAIATNGKNGSNAGVANAVGGVGKHNGGDSATVLQQAIGSGALNQNNITRIEKSKFTVVDQSKGNVFVVLTPDAGPKAACHQRP